MMWWIEWLGLFVLGIILIFGFAVFMTWYRHCR